MRAWVGLPVQQGDQHDTVALHQLALRQTQAGRQAGGWWAGGRLVGGRREPAPPQGGAAAAGRRPGPLGTANKARLALAQPRYSW